MAKVKHLLRVDNRADRSGETRRVGWGKHGPPTPTPHTTKSPLLVLRRDLQAVHQVALGAVLELDVASGHDAPGPARLGGGGRMCRWCEGMAWKRQCPCILRLPPPSPTTHSLTVTESTRTEAKRTQSRDEVSVWPILNVLRGRRREGGGR